ncbi:type II toxin-antitoxin system VapC family toxin [Mycobacterium sp.]|uniref:type II toxin-antitoxin system VapC family toxin n=1 Tax=Mycobacterium sp. TaxID=1785 RepID=UPI003C775925
MNPVVIDASAGVELAADTLRGRALRALLPADALPWVPDLFFVECGAVLRRWDLNRILTRAQIDQAIDALMAGRYASPRCAGCSPMRGGYGPTSPSLTRCTWRSPNTLAPTCFLMIADWPTPLACQSGSCTRQADCCSAVKFCAKPRFGKQ